MQAVNPSDDSSREERHAPDVVDDFFGMKEGKSKSGESAAESGVEIEGQPVVNYEKVEADIKAIRGEVTTKIEGLILKVKAVEKEVLNKIEDVIDIKIQEASNKINDRITEALRTQGNSITSVSEERVDSLRKEEVPADILPSEDTVMSEEIREKEQTDTIAPSGKIEEKISEGDVGESADFFDIEKLLEEDPFGILPSVESKTVAEEKKERDLEVPSEVKKDVKVDEKKPIEAITSSGEVEEKISEKARGEEAEKKKQSTGETVDFDIQEFLEELGTPPSEKE
ncbi:MAG: hypothetical protein ACUZ8I_15785 [Candidatus Scalindua sp.]